MYRVSPGSSNAGGVGAQSAWLTPAISAGTYTLGEDYAVPFTVPCTVTGPKGLSGPKKWRLLNRSDGDLAFVPEAGSPPATALPAGPWVVGPGELMTVELGDVPDQYVVSTGFNLNDPFPDLPALNDWSAAHPWLVVANVTRAWVGFQQYGWDGSAWIPIGGGMKHVAEFDVSTGTVDGVAVAGSNPWSWVVPAKVFAIDIFNSEGAGGGGGAGFNGSSGGGGGGAAAGVSTIGKRTARVVPGETLTITVGAKGTGGVSGGAAATSGGHTTIVGSVSGLILFLSGGFDGAPGTATSGGTGGNVRVNNQVSAGSAGTGAAGAGASAVGQSGGTLLQVSGGGGGGATGTNAGGPAGSTHGGPVSTGGTAASTLGGGGAGGATLRAKFAGGTKRTGGNTADATAPALTDAADGYGQGGGGGAARSGGQSGADGTNGHVSFEYWT